MTDRHPDRIRILEAELEAANQNRLDRSDLIATLGRLVESHTGRLTIVVIADETVGKLLSLALDKEQGA